MSDATEPRYGEPMTPEVMSAIRGTYYDNRLFLYGNNWLGTAAWYKQHYPGFTDDQCKVMEQYSNGVTAKMYRNQLKKAKKRCSGSNQSQSYGSTLLSSYVTSRSTSK